MSEGHYVTRPHLWLNPHEPLECPRGHRVHTNAALLSHDCFACQHRINGSAECGARIAVVRLGDGWKYVAEVTVGEMRHMRALRMSQDEVLAFLSESPRQEALA